MNKLIIILIFCIGLAFSQIPLQAELNPVPVINYTSYGICGLNSGAATTNITATLYGANNTILAQSNGIFPTNTTNQVLNHSFNQTENVYLLCQFDGTINQYSKIYLVSNTFWGNNDSDSIYTAVLLTVAILAFVFAYLHTNSNNYLWSNLWFFMSCLMILICIMAIIGYAQDKGAKGIENISFALFLGFIWVFILSMIIFVWQTVYNMFVLGLRAIKGEKEE